MQILKSHSPFEFGLIFPHPERKTEREGKKGKEEKEEEREEKGLSIPDKARGPEPP